MKVKVLNKVAQTHNLPGGNVKLEFHVTVELFILFNNQDVFEFVDNITEADIIPVVMNQSCWHNEKLIKDEWFRECAMHFNKNQIAVNINMLMHIDEVAMAPENLEHEDTGVKDPRSPFKKIVHLHTDVSLRNRDHNYDSFIYTDFLFNRSHVMHFDNKLLESKWDKVDTMTHWWRKPGPSEFPKKAFNLTPDDEIIPRLTRFMAYANNGTHELTEKAFVSPNLSRRKTASEDTPMIRSSVRTDLGKMLYNYQGYIGDMSQGVTLLADGEDFNDFNILGIHAWGFSPPHNDYYDSSTLSIYTETLIYNEEHASKCITEKTFTPMCKGHFVLPFGPPGTIDHLKLEYGFEFPHWIDYEYDNLPDVERDYIGRITAENILTSQRWKSYLSTVDSVCNLGTSRLYRLKKNDFKSHKVILHNRSIMRDRGQKHGLCDPQILEQIMS